MCVCVTRCEFDYTRRRCCVQHAWSPSVSTAAAAASVCWCIKRWHGQTKAHWSVCLTTCTCRPYNCLYTVHCDISALCEWQKKLHREKQLLQHRLHLFQFHLKKFVEYVVKYTHSKFYIDINNNYFYVIFSVYLKQTPMNILWWRSTVCECHIDGSYFVLFHLLLEFMALRLVTVIVLLKSFKAVECVGYM